MKRELKFRAWDIEEKRWVTDGYGLRIDLDGQTTIPYNDSEEVINVELMQYTGLKDKNGKEIFEGDIVKGDKGDTTIVVWEEEIDRDRFWATAYGFSISFQDSYATGELEIIGNIYEHPNLI